jgi:hypothetical protein
MVALLVVPFQIDFFVITYTRYGCTWHIHVPPMYTELKENDTSPAEDCTFIAQLYTILCLIFASCFTQPQQSTNTL